MGIDPPIPEPELAQIAEETSQTERRAAEAERELVEWKKIRFMEDRVGEEFAALVLNPTKYGLFVELTDLFVEGLVPIDTLRDDRYVWREHTHEIVGDRFGQRYKAGDRVQVDSGPHPGAGTPPAVLDCPGGHPARRPETGPKATQNPQTKAAGVRPRRRAKKEAARQEKASLIAIDRHPDLRPAYPARHPIQ